MSYLHDEQKNKSSARALVWITTIFILLLIALDATVKSVVVPVAAYSLLGSIDLAFAAWAAGPRIAQYIGPQIGRAAQGISEAGKDADEVIKHEWVSGDPDAGII